MTSTKARKRAEELHRRAIVIDGHSDILMPVTDGKMRLSERVEVPDPASWEPPAGLVSGISDEFNFPAHALYYGCMGQYDVPRFLEGGVTTEVCTIYIEDDQLDWAMKRGLQMAHQLHRAAEEDDRVVFVTSVDDIHRAKADGKAGVALSLEGCEPLGSEIDLLDIYHKLGLRMASLTHCRRNLYADGPQGDATTTGGLTDRGRAAIRRMNELGIVVDLVHINPVGFFEILELTTQPVVLSHTSHTNFPAADPARIGPLGFPRPELVMPRDREMLEAIAANGGVVGIIWLCKEDVADVIRDIETALQVMGPDHVGLGSDLYGLQLAPAGLEDISKTPAITRALVDRGHSDEVILKVLGGNYLRVFEHVWK
jgi:membrane dipeptidase